MLNKISKYQSIVFSPYWKILYYIMKVVFFYNVIWFAVLCYIALLDPQGTYDFSTVLEQFNFIKLFCNAIIYPASWILETLNYTTFVDRNVVGIAGSGGVKVELPCFGIKALITLFALIVSYPAEIKNKVKFILISLPLLHTLNIIRIVVLAVFNFNLNAAPSYHYQIYDYAIYAYIAFAFYLFVEYYSNKKPFAVIGV